MPNELLNGGLEWPFPGEYGRGIQIKPINKVEKDVKPNQPNKHK